jgi:DHA1 family multidrug resistance protein-like MFS transporter
LGTIEVKDTVDSRSDQQSESSTELKESNESSKDIEAVPATLEATRTRSNLNHGRNSLAIEKTLSRPVNPSLTSDGTVLITWYMTDDPANPQNWSLPKKIYVSFVSSMYNFAVYIGSSFYAPGEQGVTDHFNVGHISAALGLSLYGLAYGIGPMLWSPLREIPAVGRNPPYIATFAIFVFLTIPSALTERYAGLLVVGFLLGFFGLATAGASFQDMFPLVKIPYPMIIWAGAATLGPAIGPVVAGFTVQAKDWRWTHWRCYDFLGQYLSLCASQFSKRQHQPSCINEPIAFASCSGNQTSSPSQRSTKGTCLLGRWLLKL